MLGDRVLVVTGAESAVGRDLVAGLRERGAQVIPAAGAIESRAQAAGLLDAALATIGSDRLDAVVHVPFSTGALHRAALAAIDDSAWDAGCEAVLRSAMWVSQAAHARLVQGGGGRIVFVTATAGLRGAAERAPFATAMEGIRSLAKVGARQWGGAGITLNCVTIAVGETDAGPLPPALGRSPDVRNDLAAVVAMLADDAGGVITGVTIPLDGGVVMTT